MPLRSSNTPRPRTRTRCAGCGTNRCAAAIFPARIGRLLSHAVATETIVKKAFQDVHMLSHLVGVANRADIRRLRQLEQENGALAEKLHRQQQQLRDGFTSRDETIQGAQRSCWPATTQSKDRARTPKAVRTARRPAKKKRPRHVIADLNRKLGQETTRRERLEQRLGAMSAAMKKAEAAYAGRAGRA